MFRHIKKYNTYLIFVLLIFFIKDNYIFAQSEQIRIMAYNLLEYYNGATDGGYAFRDTYFRTVLSTVNPDILAACEFNDNTSAAPDTFLTDVLNYSTANLYQMGPFVGDTDYVSTSTVHTDANVIYYKPSKFTFLSTKIIIRDNQPSGTNHPSYEYQLYNNLTGDKIIIYGVHLTSGSSHTSLRNDNADTIRSYSDALPPGSYFISAGDYNFYAGGNEPAYATLLDQTNPGYFIDPLTLSGDWSTNSSNYQYQTLATRTTAFAQGESVGLEYRLDIILNSQSIVNPGGVTYNPSTFTTYGNDGKHHQKSINSSPTIPEGATIADALYYASDHLPVYADYTFAVPSSVNPPYQGSIAFTQVGVGDGTSGHDDEIEFVTLYRMDLTKLKITNNPVQNNDALGTVVGGGTYDLGNTDWTDVPAGTHVRLGPNLSNENLSTGLSDGILTYNGSGSSALPAFSSSGDNQVIAYTGSSSSPTYIAGLHWGGTSSVWPDPSYAPGTSSDLALGTYNNYYFNGSLTGTLYTDRNNLVDLNNWTGSSSWIDYNFQPLPVELSSFSAKVNKDGIDLSWRTETEVNNYGFEIQRSTDKVLWNKIGFVPGNGNSNSPKDYSFTDKSIPNGIIYYRLKQIDNNGKLQYLAIIEINNNSPSKATLSQNYPNPFNPVSTIEYSIPKEGFVTLKVYDILGREVSTLVNKNQSVGKYTVNFDGSGLASGIYFYVLKTNNFVLSRKMDLLK